MVGMKESKCELCDELSHNLKPELVPTSGRRYIMLYICENCQVSLVDFVLSKYRSTKEKVLLMVKNNKAYV